MNCARCGNELVLGMYDDMPAFEPCEYCIENEKNGMGYCDDCDRGDCTSCEEYKHGHDDACGDIEEVEEAAFRRGAESRRIDVDHAYDEGYSAGLDAGNGDDNA